MNKVILSGRLTKDPEIKVAQTGTKIARYSLAVKKDIKDGQRDTDFINCVTFGKKAEFAEKYLAKGVKIIVTGRLNVDAYTSNDGRKVTYTEVVVDDHEFCEKKVSNDPVPQSNDYVVPVNDEIDDCPF